MDVVIARDGEVVVSHEPWFSSVTCSLPSGEPVPAAAEERYRIFAMTYEEVARFDCGRRGHPLFPRQQKQPAVKPRLREVIEAAEAHARAHGRPPARYNIETKSLPAGDGVLHPDPETFTRLLYDVVVATGVKERSSLQSFDVRTLQAARRLDPAWRQALLVARDGDRGLPANLDALGFVPEIYSPDYRLVDEALLREAHRRGMQVIPWTVNTPGEMRRLKALGVDGLITDYPDLAQEVR
jgi:glycerophosphoryl diester phosphodiesterase